MILEDPPLLEKACASDSTLECLYLYIVLYLLPISLSLLPGAFGVARGFLSALRSEDGHLVHATLSIFSILTGLVAMMLSFLLFTDDDVDGDTSKQDYGVFLHGSVESW